jgi:HAD superfamily hydrolase (TIGR01484 family)
MHSFLDLPSSRLSAVEHVFFDVDDTLTNDGLLLPPAWGALHALRAADFRLVPVTGRSIAWGEMLMRLIGAAAVVAETGAMALVRKASGGVSVMHHEPDAAVRQELAQRRALATRAVLAAFPAIRLAVDNFGRQYDVAFDLHEDGPRVSADDAARVRDICHGHGLITFQSSVHINAFALGPHGAFSKASMCAHVLSGGSFDDVVYVGDSMNDGPMFASAGLSVGVGNVRGYLPQLQALGQAPRFVVEGEGGHGFVQIANCLLAAAPSRRQKTPLCENL